MKKLKINFFNSYGWLFITTGLLLAALLVMSQIIQRAPELVNYYIGLLVFSFSGIFLLLTLLVGQLLELYRQYQRKTSGIKTTLKITGSLMLLLSLPILILFYFSLSVLHQSVDQWFDVQTKQALADASALVKTNLDYATRDHLNKTLQAERSMRPLLTQTPAFSVNELRNQLEAKEVALYQPNGQLVAFSHEFGTEILPNRPAESLLRQARQRLNYAAIEASDDAEHEIIRVVIAVIDPFLNQVYPLQVIYNLPESITRYAHSVRLAESQYNELEYLRTPLKTSFTLILSLVLLLTLVSSLLFIIQASQNLTRPIRRLAQGTQRVAQGDYTTQMSVHRNDDFGALIQSFNDMIKQIGKARNDIKVSHQQTEVQRLYFQAVIRNLTNGVITLDMNHRIRTANDKAGEILGLDLHQYSGERFSDLTTSQSNPHLQPFFDALMPRFEKASGNKDTKPWSLQLTLNTTDHQKIILIHGSTLPSIDQKIGGFVIVLDDITELVQAQLHAAWSDVARRLAHEIKNPLTPIQLSAERLEYKLINKLEPQDANLLSRMTQTIVEQVSSMQNLVDAFIDFAHTPELEREKINLNQLLRAVVNLYQPPNEEGKITLNLDPNCPAVFVDSHRMRQLFHNLIKNALEATVEIERPRIVIETQCQNLVDTIRIKIQDNGKGISEQALNWIFEPYATDKPKGSGLGLAIVKKIIEEHKGQIEIESQPEQGACFIIKLPVGSQPTID
ncbi:ATP-binding protein [Thiomicrospira sp. R3]|uniref:sensor histidine kinase n=1 Tax=Thiomicrospira sp. R3 TaxID=3035472 RepID=UPI00259BB7AC|nr:ATP-binding protein [Thiomicrospira sp. R3]WFE69322.1 ATP-binding protein [Thiomicrospira sp. R3]